jgi:glycerophosphoryl diester phosphodiesterase
MKFLAKFEDVLLKFLDCFYAVWPQSFPTEERLKDCKIVSHRGEHDNVGVFENTCAAFDKAKEGNVWGIECDLRWTKDLQPVIHHDPDLVRIFGLNTTIRDVTLAELKSACAAVPSLKEVIQRYGKKLHIMLEVKKEIYPNAAVQNQVLAEVFGTLIPGADFHLLSLTPEMFEAITFVPRSTFVPIARLQVNNFSQLALDDSYGGIAGHYFLLSKALIQRHHQALQKVGTGYSSSRNCLFRELNRGVEWIFSNNAVELQTILNHLNQRQQNRS